MTQKMRKTIYDWDDTFFPTSVFCKNGDVFKISEDQKQLLGFIDTIIVKILGNTLKHSDVVIITNAGTGWVEDLCDAYLPQTKTFFINNNVEIISAASLYADRYENPAMWKLFAFDKHLKESGHLQIISVGDSTHEKHAIQEFAKQNPHTEVAIIKLIDSPKLDKFIYQLEFLGNFIGYYTKTFLKDEVVTLRV